MSSEDATVRKTQFVQDLKKGMQVNSLFAVDDKALKQGKGGFYLDLWVCDRTGRIELKFWGQEDLAPVQGVFDSIPQGGVVEILQGIVEEYYRKLQIIVVMGKGKIVACDNYDPSDYLPSLNKEDIDSLFSQLSIEVDSIQDEQLRKLLETMFQEEKFASTYKWCPSEKSHHHNFVGGNLQHTLNVIGLCKVMCEKYPEVDKDLLMCGAILHDVGKIGCYQCGITIQLTEKGEKVGHLVLGDRVVRETIDKLRSQDKSFMIDQEDRLSHLILSHHMKPEWNTQARPRTVEAQILHYADLMDSSVKGFLQKSSLSFPPDGYATP